MDPKLESAKGKAKEATGALTGNEELKAEGQAEQTAAKAHKAVEEAADRAKDSVGKAAQAAEGVIDSVSKKLKG
jgi:uncharacterized protein YjbJ (UPF0337 family)